MSAPSGGGREVHREGGMGRAAKALSGGALLAAFVVLAREARGGPQGPSAPPLPAAPLQQGSPAPPAPSPAPAGPPPPAGPPDGWHPAETDPELLAARTPLPARHLFTELGEVAAAAPAGAARDAGEALARCLSEKAAAPITFDYTHQRRLRQLTRNVSGVPRDEFFRGMLHVNNDPEFWKRGAGASGEYIWNSFFAKSKAPTRAVLEMGAVDGIDGSHSLFFERQGFRSLLVEADPHYARIVPTNRPNSILGQFATGCPADRKEVIMNSFRGGGRVQDAPCDDQQKDGWLCHHVRKSKKKGKGVIQPRVPCKELSEWLYSHLRGSPLDVWFLDIEGSELGTLQQFNFSAVPVGVLNIELCGAVGVVRCMQTRNLLRQRGFVFAQRVRSDDIWYHPKQVTPAQVSPAADAWHVAARRHVDGCLARHPPPEAVQ
eukprot:TRINITY_DN60313_c0_g1_i1.p1 TRINITY_DN60313_c0_g1~~TRINITY_DN60313_c0_g1_i1.p1  ORF type:complete len:461 (+),score=159.11 TRINITY_DN60313_c0_g1_i1:85-1383(+)